MKYPLSRITNILDTMEIIVDDREKDTELFRQRIKSFPCHCIRKRLSFGD